MYQHVLHLDTTSRIFLEPFNYSQTKELMQVGSRTGLIWREDSVAERQMWVRCSLILL